MSARTPRQLRVRALAKINLTLRVLALRADGYHELRTVFQSLALHDTLTLTPHAGRLTLTCDEPSLDVGGGNLVTRAAERLWAWAGRRGAPRGVAIHLAKRIPMQAGLGGGSSDAAAALRGLNAFWKLGADAAALAQLARTLGSDVPYFLEGGTAMGVDRGDLLYPLADAPSAFVVLVLPPFGVSTKDAYGWWDARHRLGEAVRRQARTPGTWTLPEWGNDLEPPVVERHREIGAIVRALKRLGAAGAAMSGSGSAVFGLFETESAAIAAAEGVRRPGRVVLLTRTVKRAAARQLSTPAGHSA